MTTRDNNEIGFAKEYQNKVHIEKGYYISQVVH